MKRIAGAAENPVVPEAKDLAMIKMQHLGGMDRNVLATSLSRGDFTRTSRTDTIR